MNGKAITSRVRKHGGKTVGEDPGMSENVEGPMADVGAEAATARITYAHGVTVNLGNFESERVDVRIELPAVPDKDSVAAVYAWAKRWVMVRLEAELSEVQRGG